MEREQIIKAIKELRKRGLSYGTSLGYHAGWCDEVADIIEELTEENERINLEYAGFEAGARHAVAFAKADTVRKMQKMIEDRCIKGGIYPAFVSRVIEQVAKEMLDGAEPFGIMDGIKKRMEQDTCVSCGAVIPEGRQVCPICRNNKTKIEEGLT